MKLAKIALLNFRQFYGHHSIEIAQDPEKNVTLIHAENGVGKTTLLNAVLWGFYGKTTEKFEQKEKIVNFEALAEGKNLARVEVTFNHEGRFFMAQREYFQNGAKSGTHFHVFSILENGDHKEIPAETFINSVIPRDMARYFFFDGEHAETFSAETNFRAVGKAIRDMLGCSLAENAIEDLKYVARELNKAIGNLPGDSDLKRLESKLEGLEQVRDEKQRALDQLKEDRVSCHEQIQTILAQLRESGAAKELQLRRDEKTQQLTNAKASLKGAEQEVIRWVGSKALPLVAQRLTKETLDFIDEQSLKGRIPSPYNEDFVRGLLKASSCICGRDLVPESPEWSAVSSLLRNASNAEVLSRVMRARSRVRMLKESRPEALTALFREQSRVGELTEQRRLLEQEVGEIGKRIEALPLKEIAEREQAHREISSRVATIDRNIGAHELAIKSCERQLNDVQTEFDRSATKNEKAQLLIARRDLALQSAQVLATYLESHEKLARESIAKQVNDILDSTARREYKFEFGENFELNLQFKNGQSVPRSSGENQLVSLAFIASLVAFSHKRATGDHGDILIPGTVAPLVLDSPFGQLDSRYRVDTARFVPKLAEQVILLVSSSQGDKEVLDVLDPHIGAEYVLIAENRAAKGNRSSDSFVLRGRQLETSLFNCQRDLTRIDKVC